MSLRIPFNKPSLEGRELEYIAQAVESGQISGNGRFTRACEALLERMLGTARAFLTPSGTHALELAAMLLRIQPGDEVVLPSFTFVSTANAFVLHGARPVFADIRPDTLNLDEARLADRLGPRTKTVVPVHYGGVACEMDAILEVAGRRGVPVVEDNAHGLCGTYRGVPLGTFGCLGVLSFHETKNVTCGEGGALLVNAPELVARAEILREKGTDRGRFFRGEVDKYTWVDVGSSYVLSDVLSAFLYAQLEARERIQVRRRCVWRYYAEHLAGWAGEHGVRLPVVPPHCQPSYHLFYLVLPTPEDRTRLIAHLKARGILSVFHYQPLHLSEMGRGFGGKPGDCPVTEKICDRLLRLPFYNTLTEADQAFVVEAVTAFDLA